MDETKDITAYKPNPSVIQAFQFDEKLPDNDLSFDLLRKLTLARKTQDVLFLAIGKMLKTFKERKLYKQLDFETFEQFLASEEISFSREKAYMMIRIYEFYSEYLELSEDVIKDFPIVRLSLMLPILKKMPDKADQIKELERVKSLRHSDFVRDVKTQTNMDGKPQVYFSNEADKWIVNYYENVTALVPLGNFVKEVSDGQ
jgi:hypothetical protein